MVAVDLGDVAQAKAPVESLPGANPHFIKYSIRCMAASKRWATPPKGIGPIECFNLFKFYGRCTH